MAFDGGERGSLSDRLGGVRERIGVHTLLVVFSGVLAGYSLSVLGKDAVVVPVVGSVPGLLLGAVGLLSAFGAYRQVGCCGECNQRTYGMKGGCGCDDDCGDSFSYDP